MNINGIISAVIVGAIIGGLGRLVVRGNQHISLLMTIVIGNAVDCFLGIRTEILTVGNPVVVGIRLLFGTTIPVRIAVAILGNVRTSVLIIGYSIVVPVMGGGREANACEKPHNGNAIAGNDAGARSTKQLPFVR